LLEKFRVENAEFPWIDIARHFSIGFDQVKDSKHREQIGQIMREAGNITAKAASFEVALTFTEKAFACLQKRLSRIDRFQMHLKMLEYSFLVKNEEKLAFYRQQAMDLTQDKAEKLTVYELLIRGLDFGNHPKEAVATTRQALAEVGIHIPEKANKLQVIWQAVQINSMLPSSKFEQIPTLPLAQDEETKAIFRVLVAALPPYFFSNIETYPLLIFQIIKLTLKRGLTPESVPGLASYGLILSGAMKKPRQGYEVVKETFKLLETVPGAEKYTATIYMIYLAFISHIKENIREQLPMAQEGFRKGLAAGNMEYASWNMLFDVLIKYQLGVDYEKLLKEGNEVSHFQRQYNFFNQEAHLAVCLRAVEVIVSPPNAWENSLKAFNETEEEYFRNAVAEKNAVYLVGYYGIKGCLNLWYGKFHDAFSFLRLMKQQLPNQVPSFLNHNNQFQYALSCAMIAVKTGERKVSGVDLVSEIQAEIRRLKKSAELNPRSEIPIYLFLEAIVEWIVDRHINHENFERSIDMLNDLGYPMMYVNFCEWYADLLAGKDNAKHDYFLNCAILQSRQMKTESKTQHLMESLLLDSSTRSSEQSVNKGSGSLQIASLDTKTLVKTMQALISEIKVESLLQKLLTYAMENTGAQEGHFIINRNDTWVHEVSIKANHTLHTEFPRIDLEQTSEVSKSIIHYSSRTQEPLVIANAMATMPFDVDPIVLRKKIKSVLCIPFINQSKISGIIYLSHSQMTEAFKVEHISLMRLMAGQIGTIIENALLYEQMENLVKERTRQLEHEKLKSDNLLLNILPKEVANELKETGKASARLYESVSVMFIDIKSFTTIAQDMTPDELVKNLDRLFSGFDSIVTDLNLEKIKTIGDAYMVAGGIPVPAEHHLLKMLEAAFLIHEFIREQNIAKTSSGEPAFEVRIGIHIGPVVAGVVGDRKFAYDIWGDTVNIASRMEQNSEPGKVNVSERVFEQISERYDCEYRGQIPVKNKGNMKMYFVKKIEAKALLT
jgi:class 3 adenylate cyclase